MKRLLLILIMIISSSVIFAQNENTEQKMTRSEKNKAEFEKSYKLVKQLLEDKNFVLETNYLLDRYGNRIVVSSNINFVKVDGDNAVIQIGSDETIGPNGVGGTTAKGKITKWTLTEKGKSKRFYVQMNVITKIGIYDLSFSVSGDGQALATLTSTGPGLLTFDGDIVPLDESGVYEGTSL